MTTEWFDRVTEELQDHLNSICEQYDQVGHMNINRASKHPRIEFFVSTLEDERDYFCTILFDPYNEEFYVESFDVELLQPTRIMLDDITDIIEAVHESFHEFLEDDSESELIYLDDDGDNDDNDDDDEIMLEEIDVDWETPEVTAFLIDDNIEVTYQFGIDSANGDGVLRRRNRSWVDDEEFVDESTFTFKKDEASTIIAMIASHMDKLIGYDEIIDL
ncbi:MULTISPECIES: hypothetical protein [Psychrobacillus]|uniref:Uncharacterized protein n=1 Tax=Psychrobacillus faecigallinarum TaxID=2762235 RepID=A0ABR8R9F2_9BACI|nr:hypothetical protein [Psychrobacillus faecigallinarum]MBD7944285.1 hypothetical protein [Psychrobacillus faecigallinarum]QGM31653.1 hypothetical protein GI482_15270 [Bacillus sp. N3536]